MLRTRRSLVYAALNSHFQMQEEKVYILPLSLRTKFTQKTATQKNDYLMPKTLKNGLFGDFELKYMITIFTASFGFLSKKYFARLHALSLGKITPRFPRKWQPTII